MIIPALPLLPFLFLLIPLLLLLFLLLPLLLLLLSTDPSALHIVDKYSATEKHSGILW